MTAIESTGPIAVVVAMDAELVHLVGDLANRTGDVGGRPRYDLDVAGRRLVVVRCGIGMLNAASTTERIVAELGPSALLNYGSAGSHRRDILPGDIVVTDRVVYTAALNILPDGSERHIGFGYEVAGETIHAADLAVDPSWLGAARSAAAHHQAEPWPDSLPWPASRSRRAPLIHVGAVASADIWTQQIARLETLTARHGSLCEDMEAAAIAHVAALHGVPFLSIKDISNNELHTASDLAGFSDFPTTETGRRSAALLLATISAWLDGSQPS